MKKYYFTYGSNHTLANGISLGQYYTCVEAESYMDALQMMFKARGDKWAFQYTSAEDAGVKRFRLIEAPLKIVGLPKGMR